MFYPEQLVESNTSISQNRKEQVEVGVKKKSRSLKCLLEIQEEM